jgi:hypothetical protein
MTPEQSALPTPPKRRRHRRRGRGGQSCRQRFRVTARVLVCSASLLVLAGSNLNLCASWSKPQSKPKVVARSAPIFNFHDDEFWLNLHHFLYVLGRAENKTRDSSRAAVSGAPADQQQGMARLTTQEQAVWKEAVLNYAAGPAKKDLVFDDPLRPSRSRSPRPATQSPSRG